MDATEENDGVHDENRHLFDGNNSGESTISKLATDKDNNRTGPANKRKAGDDDDNTDNGKKQKDGKTKSSIVEYN